MQLVLSEDQELLAKTAADFVSERSPLSRVRELRDRGDATGFSRALWKEMAELGWVGIPIPEVHGGAGMGLADLAVVLEALGRELAPEPFVSTVLAVHLLAAGGGEAQQGAWLPRLAAGDAVLAAALQEPGGRYALERVGTRAVRQGGDFVLEGEKLHALDAPGADALIVSARSGGGEADREGVGLFVVPADAPGLAREPQRRVDGRPAARVRLSGVRVPAAASLGEPGAALPLLEDAVDRATAALCAEMLGGMARAFEMTLEHLRTRVQFGVPIGSFQALKHRAADVFIEIELCRSAVMAATRALDEGDPDARKLVSLAKAHCSDAFLHAANEGVQMFGGVGMTDEYDIGFYLKRARAAQLGFGDAAWHRARWAQLSGY